MKGQGEAGSWRHSLCGRATGTAILIDPRHTAWPSRADEGGVRTSAFRTAERAIAPLNLHEGDATHDQSVSDTRVRTCRRSRRQDRAEAPSWSTSEELALVDPP